MKLVGITGKAGSGKTTFSNMLSENSQISVIHIDDILKEIKLKYFKLFMKRNSQGEKTKVDSGLKAVLYKDKILFNIFMRFRAKLIEKPLMSEIQALQELGNKIILIDDIFLQYQKCYNDLSLVILMERPYKDRKVSLIERDNLSKEELVAYDMAHSSGNYKDLTHSNKTIKITNNQNKESLKNTAQQIYQEYFSTFQDKYKFAIPEVVNGNTHEIVKEKALTDISNIENTIS